LAFLSLFPVIIIGENKMNSALDCIPCFFKQALKASEMANLDNSLKKKIFDEIALLIPDFSLETCPPQMARDIHHKIKKLSGNDDPYLAVKQESFEAARAVRPLLEKKIEKSENQLLTAVELAIAGNIIDFGAHNHINLAQEIETILKREETALTQKKKHQFFEIEIFTNSLAQAGNLLYLGDNVGETVFDSLLIKKIKELYPRLNITYVVKSAPVLNDALAEDARAAGIDAYARIIENGYDAPGTIMSKVSKDFIKHLEKADMIISKGQGNFESLSAEKLPLFFMFMVKCPVVARQIQAELGDFILVKRDTMCREKYHYKARPRK